MKRGVVPYLNLPTFLTSKNTNPYCVENRLINLNSEISKSKEERLFFISSNVIHLGCDTQLTNHSTNQYNFKNKGIEINNETIAASNFHLQYTEFPFNASHTSISMDNNKKKVEKITNVADDASKKIKKRESTCFVPSCSSTTVKTPEKIFVRVPENRDLRILWCKAVGLQPSKIQKNCYCCEDHFNVNRLIKSYYHEKYKSS